MQFIAEEDTNYGTWVVKRVRSDNTVDFLTRGNSPSAKKNAEKIRNRLRVGVPVCTTGAACGACPKCVFGQDDFNIDFNDETVT